MTLNDLGIYVLGLLTGLVLRWQLMPPASEEKPAVVINNNYYQAATMEITSGDEQNPEWPDSLNTGAGTE